MGLITSSMSLSLCGYEKLHSHSSDYLDIFRSAIFKLFFVTPTGQMFENSKTGPWSQLLDTLVPGPNTILVNGPGPRCNGPWSLGPFGQWSLVPGPPYRVSLLICVKQSERRYTVNTSWCAPTLDLCLLLYCTHSNSFKKDQQWLHFIACHMMVIVSPLPPPVISLVQIENDGMTRKW